MCAPAIYRSIQLYATCAARSRTPSPPSHCVLLPVHHTVHIHACVRPCIVRVAMAHDAVLVLRHSSHRRLKCVRAQNNSQTECLRGTPFKEPHQIDNTHTAHFHWRGALGVQSRHARSAEIKLIATARASSADRAGRSVAAPRMCNNISNMPVCT